MIRGVAIAAVLLSAGAARAAEVPAATGDLAEIQKRGTLRVIVPGSGNDFLPRSGMPASYDRDLALELGARLNVEIEFVLVDSYDRLIPALLEGRGDVIAAQLTQTEERAEKVAFSQPTMMSAQIVVGKKGATDLPRAPPDLAGREVHVRASSAYAETLRKVAAADVPGIVITPVPENVDTETILYDVARGKRPLTLVDTHILTAVEGYEAGVERLFPLAKDLPISWAFRKDNPALKEAVDRFLVEKALTTHTREVFTGDLDGIKQRRVLRVLTRNNAISYFLYRGDQFGFDYELMKMFAADLGVRLEMVVVPSRDQLITWLREGRGDVIAAAISPSPDRAELVAFTQPYLFVEQMLVRRSGKGKALKTPADLRGQTVHVRGASVYRQTLVALREKIGPFTIVDEPEDVETEELIARVGQGKIPFTVADSHILDSARLATKNVEGVFSLESALAGEGEAEKTPVAFATRKQSPALLAALDAFVKRNYRGLEYNMLRKRYFENQSRAVTGQRHRAAKSGTISPYDTLIRKHAKKHGFDWRLLAAQVYHESKFDPKAESWAGARGLFQIMPRTAAELGYKDVNSPEQGIAAGVEYMSRLFRRFDPGLELRQRIRFTLAAYNAGLGHVQDARRLAAELGLDPNRWFHNVEKAMLLLEKPEYAKRARNGYCRGSEPVAYVSRIQSSFDAYVKVLPP